MRKKGVNTDIVPTPQHDTVRSITHYPIASISQLDVKPPAFFRDAEAFNVLSKKVIPFLFKQQQRTGKDIRVWCPVCGGGEEVYSIAILCAEYAEKHRLPLNIKLFASDSRMLANEGVYEPAVLQGVSPHRLNRYFIKRKDKYSIVPELRQMVIFASHDLLNSPSYINMDLISYRQMMDVKPVTHRHILSLLHSALNHAGFLFLGHHKGMDALTPYVETISSTWKIYQKTKTASLPSTGTPETKTTELKIAEEKLYQMAHYDELTLLPNRATFIQLMLTLIEESADKNIQFALLFIDLDNFKRVNDNLGHTVGDALLCAVAGQLKRLTRRADIIARLGGDEFGILLKHIHSVEEVERITLRYIHAFSMKLNIGQYEIKTSLSIGLALYPHFGQTPYELLQNADAAMYHAKQHGKNNYFIFDQKVKDLLIRRHAIDTQLQHALDKHEFSVVYQLKFDLKTNQPVGIEALIRWSNDTLGPVVPDEFIPVAEENRLIIPMGYWLMEQVVRDYKKMINIVKSKTFSLAINMSMLHLSEPDFEYQISQMLLRYDYITPKVIIFELTETALMERPEIAAELLSNIAKMGIRFALDDFGTGYSTLQHIKTFPISSLKIDKSFIKDLYVDDAVMSMVKAMIAFTKILGMKVTAEGVETQEQLDFLKKEGCDDAQGFLLSRPIPLDELLSFLKKQRLHK